MLCRPGKQSHGDINDLGLRRRQTERPMFEQLLWYPDSSIQEEMYVLNERNM